MGRPAGWMKELTGREAMRSPGAPSLRREVERQFWAQIATGITSEKAAEAVGVSPVVGDVTPNSDPTILSVGRLVGLPPKPGPARLTLCGTGDAGGGRHGSPEVGRWHVA
jgi:hypothetical protein